MKDVVNNVYSLIGKRDVALSIQAWKLARQSLEASKGEVRLALYEAITDILNNLLMDLGEHGIKGAAFAALDSSSIDVRSMVEECVGAWEEVKRLHEAGVSSQNLVGPYVGTWLSPIGSSDWMNRMRLGIPRRKDEKWILRIIKHLSGEAAEE